jgi:LCP family protein required for cell wall assembly
VLAFTSLLAAICLVSALGLAYFDRQLAAVPRVQLGGALSPSSPGGGPENFLLVGTDRSAGLAATDPVLSGRIDTVNTDTIMILRVDPADQRASLLSLPRDLWVAIQPGGTMGKINSALPLGGPEALIRTIGTDFGITINHYVQVDFEGFKSLVDSIGGVPVWVNYPIRDQHTGLELDQLGCQSLDGDQALAFARSRYFEGKPAGTWIPDPTSDFGRIKRQQYFIKQALKKAIARGARNPIELSNLLSVAQQYVQIDQDLTPQDLLDLGTRFEDFNPDNLDVYTVPATDGTVGDASVLFLDQANAQPTLNIFRGVDASKNAAAAVRVAVRNGTGTAGQGQQVAGDLTDRGFTVPHAAVDDSSFHDDRTVIGYAPGQQLAAALLARFLGISPVVQPDPTLTGTDTTVSLTLGSDFTGILAQPRPVADVQQYLPAPTTPTSPAAQASTAAQTSTAAPAAPAAPPTTAPDDTTGTHTPLGEAMVPSPPPGVSC